MKLNFIIKLFFKSFCSIQLFWIISIISILFPFQCYTQLNLVQNEFNNYKFNSPNFQKYLIIDTMNQLQLNGTTRIISTQLTLNNIELYSKFDGNHALQFLPIFFNCDSNEICKTNLSIKTQGEFLTKAAFFTGSKNGFFQAFHKGRYKTIHWLVHPYLEISNGIYYPDENQSFLKQKVVSNSSFQNISGRTEFGIKNEKSYLLFDSYLSFANLYKPLNLLDSNMIKHKFGNYNNLLAQIKFSNTFSDFLKITGRIFLKNFLRDYSTMIDSTIFSFDSYNNEFEIEEFNYGFNSLIEYDSRITKHPVHINLSYTQDLFLVNSSYLKARSRIESENLNIGYSQLYDYSDRGNIQLSLNSSSRAILYSNLGKLPNNVITVNFEFKNNYQFDSTINLSSSFSRKHFLPFISHYYSISENYQNNLNIEPELWYYVGNTFNIKFNQNFNIKSILNLYYGHDIIILEKTSRKFSNSGVSKGLELGLTGEYKLESINFKFDGVYNFQNVNEKEILLSDFLRMPAFISNFNLNHIFYNFLELELNIKFTSGIYSYDPRNHNIEMISPDFLVNLLIQKQYDNAYFTLILRNLTNRYYETNIGIPDRGISFLLGTVINF